MKGNKKILVVAVLLLLIAVSYSTYAIYRTNLTANTTVNTAHWSAVLTNGSNSGTTLNFTMADFNCGNESTRHGKNNTIAPGDTCTLVFGVDLDGSEVNAKVNAALGTVTGTVEDSRFTVGLSVGGVDANGVAQAIPYSATEGEMELEYTLTLTWQGDTDNLAANGKDVKDVSMNGQSLVIPVTIDAYQDMGA